MHNNIAQPQFKTKLTQRSQQSSANKKIEVLPAALSRASLEGKVPKLH